MPVTVSTSRGAQASQRWGRAAPDDGADVLRHVLAGLAVGAWQSVAAKEAAELTTRTVSGHATKQALRASDNAVKQAAIAADVEKVRIATEAEAAAAAAP